MDAEMAIQEGNTQKALDLCDKISSASPGTKNPCYEKVALATNDVSICDKMIEEKTQYPTTKKRDICYSSIAEQTKNTSICEQIRLNFIKDCNKALKISKCEELSTNLDIVDICYRGATR